MDTHAAFVAVEEGQLYPFKSRPNAELRTVRAGIYTIWQDGTLLYVGMAGRSLTEDRIALERQDNPKSLKGLYSRLKSHASGRRSGDQFCLYVCDRLILPGLTPEEIGKVGNGTLNLDALVRAYIHDHLSYRFAETQDSDTAMALEEEIRQGRLKVGKPLLNPSRTNRIIKHEER
ncbi:MAG: hypothetical protein ICV83_18605 [Cytophagales bacterium]|nr:hypothetical protein [Cytophagales bacterium]